MSFNVSGKQIVVLGGRRSGIAASELLVSRGASVVLSDTAASLPEAARLESLGVRVELGPHREELLRRADLIVLSPGVPPDQPALRAARAGGIPVIGEVELASRWVTGRLIAITGTKGKSTTTTLAAKMLAEAGLPAIAGGNLGEPLSAQVGASRADSIHVVEVSSFQLEGIDTFHPWISVLVNVSADHLDRHASFAEYAAAKARVFMNQTRQDWAVINADDPTAMSLAATGRARRFDFALDRALEVGVTVEQGQIVRRERGTTAPLVPLSSVRLPGRHLLKDVLAAAAIGCIAGIPPAAMQRAVEGFNGLEHALERVGEIDGVQFVNDSKATNIASARSAIESFERGVVPILGGRYKGGNFGDLADALAERGDAVVAIGEAKPLIREALSNVLPVHEAESMLDAVRRAFAAASPGGVVVLAPACSSFDMFTDYAARGRSFKEAVRHLAAEVGTERH